MIYLIFIIIIIFLIFIITTIIIIIILIILFNISKQYRILYFFTITINNFKKIKIINNLNFFKIKIYL